jgi:diguanylate cyclase (GGDEF)-like protein
MSPLWVIVVAVAESVLLTIGTLLVLSFVRDVRRRRAMVTALPTVESDLDRALQAVAGASDRSAALAAVAAGAFESTHALTVAVVLRSGRGVLEVATLAGETVGSGALLPAGVSTVIDQVAPRRWVDPGSDDGSVGPRAYIVAPVVVDGCAIGALVGTRPGATAFGIADLDAVCQLAAVELPAEPALVDDLTDLPTRRRLDHDLGLVAKGQVGLAVVAIDHFLRIGHEVGPVAIDRLVRELVDVVAGAVRDGDMVYRYGDGKFGVLLPSAGNGETAEVAERLRMAVEAHEFALDEDTTARRITVSVGTVVADAGALADITRRADDAVSEAERFGRNRVVESGHA